MKSSTLKWGFWCGEFLKTMNHRGTETQRKARRVETSPLFSPLTFSVPLWLTVFLQVFRASLNHEILAGALESQNLEGALPPQTPSAGE
jgi:hypothetical protein